MQSFNYQVDKLYTSEATTQEIYEDIVAPLVPFAQKGGIATLFAYGQTGSGKTFTISRLEKLVASALMTVADAEGAPDEADENNHARRTRIYISIIDLAGNAAHDLLSSRKPIQILEDGGGETRWAGAVEHEVCDTAEVLEMIERAAAFRATAPTLKNDASSRSHSICRLRIVKPAAAEEGMLYLVDLAGSEAARDIAVHGAERMRETKEINISLSALKDCIRGRAQADAMGKAAGPGKTRGAQAKKVHIPFRQSTLTKVLKHVFDPTGGRRCKTVVVACVNPSLADVAPSKNTLRYAEMLRASVLPSETGREGSGSRSVLGSGTTTPGVKTPMRPESALPSSRDLLDPVAAMVPFKERIRPAMVVSWKREPNDSLQLAVVLAPASAFLPEMTGKKAPGIGDGGEGSSGNEETDVDQSRRFVCASLLPRLKPNTFELSLWQQIVVHVDMMDSEVILECDTATRYYRVAS
jgi:kinesin family protein 2/24